MRRLVAAVAVAVGFTLLSVPAAQASHPRSQIVVAPQRAYQGQLVEVAGSCRRVSVARVEIDRVRFALFRTGARGHFRFVKRIPSLLRAGPHRMYLFCDGRFRAADDFRVLGRSRAPFAVAPTNPHQGELIRIQGAACLPRTTVYFRLDSHRLIGQTTSQQNWFFRGTARIPSSTPVGTHRVNAQCRVGGRSVGSRSITVQDDYPGLQARAGGLRVDRSTVVAGRSIAISARSCRDGVTDASLGDTSIQLAAPARRDGVLYAKAAIPSGTPAGTYRLTTRCDGTVAGMATVHVMAANAAVSGITSSLPDRRSSIVPGVSLGLALIVTGALVLVPISRRRRGTVRQ
jgi:hypothetical protein